MSDFEQPYLRPIGKDEWKVTRVWHGYFDRVIPKGFVCDLDSIPRIPFVYARFKGHARGSAVGHDWDYRIQLVDRKQADDDFYRAMIREGVGKRTAEIMWRTLRVVGGLAWKKNEAEVDLMRARYGVFVQ